MNLTNLSKSIIAVSVLTYTSFGANASVISEASIDVTALKVTIFDESETVVLPAPSPGGFDLHNVAISLNGTSESSTLNANTVGSSYNTAITDPFNPLSVNLNSNQQTGAVGATSIVNTVSSINGNIFAAAGANGSTSASTTVYGVDSGDANSQIINNLDADFAFTTSTNGWAKISFDWLLETYVSVFDQGGEGVADWGLTITLTDDTCTGFSCTPLYSFDLNDEVPVAQTGTLNDIGEEWDETANDTVATDFIRILAGVTYTLDIAQSSNSAAISVPEPSSLAILGLGILGLAGAAARRRKA
jgi:hypothetical protein